MRLFALSDPHLALSTPDKRMDMFGPQWVDHHVRMASAWDELVAPGDLVLVPGDVSWARRLEGAAADLEWLAERPGTKVMIKGNHEMWWSSRAKVRKALPEGVLALEADATRVGDIALCGTRMWDVPGVDYHDWIAWQGEAISPELSDEDAKHALSIYRREVGRLDRALAALDEVAGDDARLRVCMVHYPPVAPGLASNELTERFEAARVDHVVFGHLHSLKPERLGEIGGVARGVTYTLASCDAIDFAPTLIADAT